MADRDLVRKDRQSSPAASPRGINYLLAIAINEYQHCSKLNNAVRDVEAFIDLITSHYNFETTNVTFIKDAEATEKRIRRAFDRLIDVVTEQDNLIVYFSGHGRHHERRGGYWIPVEAGTSDDDWSDYISNDVIKSYLSKIKSFHTFLIADSCFSGSLFIDKSKEKFSGDRRDTEPSRWGLTSGKKEIVSDGQPGQHSPFATALLGVLRKADKPLGVVSLCDQVMEVVTASEHQTPMFSPLKVEGHQYGQYVFYFREEEATDWQTAQQTDTRQAYSNFYRRYPHGKYTDEALAKLELAEEKEIWDQVPKNREASLLRFIRENATSPYAVEAQRLIDQLHLSIKSSAAPIVPPTPTIIVPDHMVMVKRGTFQMGEGSGPHPVTLSDFLIAKHPLTFEEYDAFCNATGRDLPSDEEWGRGKRPVIDVSWFDAIDYCNWRSQQEGLSPVYQVNQKQVSPNWQATGYRLPTEAEWEYAARGGQRSLGYKYAGSNDLDDVAWYEDNSGTEPPLIGQKKANELGLHDMSGNVFEWCWGSNSNFSIDVKLDPKRSESNSACVARGGSWLDNANNIQVTFGNEPEINPNLGFLNVGFRLARATVAL